MSFRSSGAQPPPLLQCEASICELWARWSVSIAHAHHTLVFSTSVPRPAPGGGGGGGSCNVCGQQFSTVGLAAAWTCASEEDCSFAACAPCMMREHAPTTLSVPNHPHPLARHVAGADGARVYDHRRFCDLCGRRVQVSGTHMQYACANCDVDVCADCAAALIVSSERRQARAAGHHSPSPCLTPGTVFLDSHRCPLKILNLTSPSSLTTIAWLSSGRSHGSPSSSSSSSSPSFSSAAGGGMEEGLGRGEDSSAPSSLHCRGCGEDVLLRLREGASRHSPSAQLLDRFACACHACRHVVCAQCVVAWMGLWGALFDHHFSGGAVASSTHTASALVPSLTSSSSFAAAPSNSTSSSGNSPNSGGRRGGHALPGHAMDTQLLQHPSLLPRTQSMAAASASPAGRHAHPLLRAGSSPSLATAASAALRFSSSSPPHRALQEAEDTIRAQAKEIAELRAEVAAVRSQLAKALAGEELETARSEVSALRDQLAVALTLSGEGHLLGSGRADEAPGGGAPGDGPGGSSVSPPPLEKLTDLQLRAALIRVDRVRKSLRRERERRMACVVCLERRQGVLFLPCAHLCTCSECGERLESCPVCRERIAERMEVPAVAAK